MSQNPPVPVHSIQEEHLYILLVNCACGQSYEPVSQTLTEDKGRKVDRVEVKCPACGREDGFLFDVTGFFGDADRYGSLRVNPTDEPSRAIDLEGWTRLALFYLNLGAQAESGGDRTQTDYMAAQCLDEAIKIFPAGEEKPPAEAFFVTTDEEVRENLRQQESFRRSNLIELRRRLPPTGELWDRVRRLAEKRGSEGSGEPAG